jgi:two-component system uhpT operon response regulator UhpA
LTAVSVVIISTSALTRGGIQQIVGKPDVQIEVVNMTANFTDASSFMRDHNVRVAIIDDSFPRAVNLTRELKKLVDAHPGLAMVLIMQRPMVSTVRAMLNSGARAILFKDDDLDRALIQAIHMAADGGTTISPTVSRLLEQQTILPSTVDQRDMDVLQLLTDGFQPKEIAAHLGVDRKIVYRGIKKLSVTYGAHNVAQLVDIAHQHKLLPLKKKE